MVLKKISVEEFTTFADNSPYVTFMQTEQIAKLKEKNGWQVYYLGMYNQESLLGVTLLVGKKRHFNKLEFYAPRGPLLDYNDERILKEFLSLLKTFCKEHNGYILRIDPYVLNIERNNKGEKVPNGFDNSKISSSIISTGFKLVPLEKREQVSWMYALDIKNKTEDEVLKNLKASTRNIIRKTMKSGIEIIELEKKDLKEFYDIMLKTGQRKDFAIRSLKYFEDMYDLFKPKEEIKYLITKLNLTEYIEYLTKEKKAQEELLNNLTSSKSEGKRKTVEETINGLDKRINIAKNEKEKYGEVITLSGSMFIMTHKEIIYLSGGNYEEFMNYNSQYLIQWEMIKYAVEHHYDKYNFYGIPATFDKNDKDYGIYEFKDRFNGHVEELIGEFESPLSVIYYLIKLIHKIKY